MNLPDIVNPKLPIPGKLTKWGYREMTEEEYRSFPAVNNSLLKCPTLAEMYAMLTAPQKQTDALALGTLTDMAVLTPKENWRQRFVLADIPSNPTTGKAYALDSKKAEAIFAATAAANPGKFVVSIDQMEAMAAELNGMVRALNASALCRQMLENSLTQVSGVMWHPIWNCWVKWKPDILPLKPDPKIGWIIGDLKTSRHHPLQFEKDCFEFSYFDQAGWYSHCHETLMAQQGLTLKVNAFDFLLISKEDDGRRPRPAMARRIRVPLDPDINLHMAGYRRRVFPADGMGRVEMFLSALEQHIAQNPDPADEQHLSRIWGAYEHESEPFILCKMPRN